MVIKSRPLFGVVGSFRSFSRWLFSNTLYLLFEFNLFASTLYNLQVLRQQASLNIVPRLLLTLLTCLTSLTWDKYDLSVVVPSSAQSYSEFGFD